MRSIYQQQRFIAVDSKKSQLLKRNREVIGVTTRTERTAKGWKGTNWTIEFMDFRDTKMADEEDVVFVNSPLYKHLADVGCIDFDAQSLNSASKQYGTSIDASAPLKSRRELENRIFYPEAFVNLVNKIYGLIWCFLAPSTSAKEIACHSSYISLIKSSQLLTDDDVEFVYKFEQCIGLPETEILKDYKGEIRGTGSSEHDLQSWFTLLTSHSFIGLVVMIAIVLGSISAFGLHLCMVSFIILVVLLFMCKSYSLWWNNRIYYLHNQNILLISHYFQVIEELLLLIRKAVLFIQEKELLARGHIIISPMVPVSRMESSSTACTAKIRQCMMLRKCIFIEANEFINVLYNETKAMSSSKLFEHNKMLSWLDKDIGIIDTKWMNIGSDDDTTSETSKFTLVSLKKVFGCLVSQQSLLLSYVMLKSCSVIDDLKTTKKGSNLNVIQTCFKHLLEKGNKCLDKVRCCYRFHKVDIPADILDKESVDNLGNELGITFSPFFVTVHSMSLHLQEATKMSVSLEEKLEGINSKTSTLQEFVVEHFDELEKVLMHIKSDIDSLTSCWSESHKTLQDILLSLSVRNEMKESCSRDKSRKKKLEGQDKGNFQVLNITGTVDAVPDQVFEGEASSGVDDQKLCSITLDREELFMEQKGREESRHLLQELKSVLATKDEQTMVGIPRALLLKKLDDIESKSTVEKQAVNIDDNNTCFTKQNEPRCLTNQSKYDGCEPEKNFEKDSSSPVEYPNQVASTDAYNSLGLNSETKGSTFVNSFASMVAAAALARNNKFNVKEQSYEMAGEFEPIEDGTYSNDD